MVCISHITVKAGSIMLLIKNFQKCEKTPNFRSVFQLEMSRCSYFFNINYKRNRVTTQFTLMTFEILANMKKMTQKIMSYTKFSMFLRYNIVRNKNLNLLKF